MTNETLEKLKYPIGRFVRPVTLEASDILAWKQTIASFPERIKSLCAHLSDDQKGCQYRPGGWNVAQIVHHCADSHMNAYIRFKLTLTEDKPTIKPYNEVRWAELTDGNDLDFTSSFEIITGLHRRWSIFLDALTSEDLKMEYIHPDHNAPFSLGLALANYDWHCRQHLAHIEQAIASEGKFG